jgi:hypothetical protein
MDTNLQHGSEEDALINRIEHLENLLDKGKEKYNKLCTEHLLETSRTQKVLSRLIKANESLAQISENKITYYEDSPLKNPECCKRWEELNKALSDAKEIME